MATLSFLEKLAILFEVSKSSTIFIISIIIIILLGLILLTTNRLNFKSSRKLFILFYIFIISAIVVLYKESLLNMLQYLMDNLFVVIYFPNLAVYFAAIIITNIILWCSVFNFKTPTIIKNINIIVYLLMSYLLIVLLSIVNTQKLDVFNQASIYGNQSSQAIIELSSTLFMVWIIFLLLYKFIIIYLTRNNKLPVKNNKTRVVVKNSARKLPHNITEVPVPYMVKAMPTFAKNIKQADELAAYDSLLTIEDYKLLLDILKEKKEEKNKEVVPNKVITSQEEKHEKELEKFRELQELYGVR